VTHSDRRIGRFKVSDTLNLAYEAFGQEDGETILFAHGGGQTRHAWKGTAEALGSQGFRTIALDLRGHGDSDWSSDGDYGVLSIGADLVSVSGMLGDRPPHIVGASLGGIGAIMAAGKLQPNVFATITLVDIVPRMESSGVEKIMGFMGAHVDEGFATLDEAAEAIAAYMPHRPRPKDLSGLKKNLRRCDDGRWRWHWDPAFIRTSTERRQEGHVERMEAAVEAIKVPIHLVRGRMSELVSEAAVTAFKELAPHAAYTDVADARHMVAGDRNDIFTDAVTGFLERHRISA
jgi:pimeloyl-ACP methyl ester carboxylesterase